MKKTINILILLIAITFGSVGGFSQPVFPDDGQLYRDDVVGRVDILINPDTLQWIYENVESDIEWRAIFIFDNGIIRDTIQNIGFRLRGNTSRQSAKKSFKVSFNTFESGRKYLGVEKMNLNGEHNDPTVARSKVSWDLCRQAGIPASRSNYVQVYINDTFYGLYINVEHIDEEFVDKRYGNQDGNLYKCLWPADLNYLGSDPENYKGGAYTLKTNVEADDYSDIANFIGVLNNTPIGELECELEKIFNVQDYLKIMAMDVFTANWDGYIFNKNNFYLYHNTETGKFEYIPYDLDNTYGIDWFNIDWATRDIYNWENEYRPLYERLLEIQKYRDWYSWYFSQIMELMNPDIYFTRINEIRDQIYPYIQNDDYYTYDYGFTPQDFLDSYETGLGSHVPYGLKEYITTRYNSANNQLDINNIEPIVNYLKAEHSGPGSIMEVSVYIFDDEENPSANLLFNINDEGWESVAMTSLEDGKFVGQLEIPEGESTVLYQIVASDFSGNTSVYPCEPIEVIFAPGETYQLYINEFLASNAATNTDEAGEYDDWLEIYNAGNDPVWLGDKYLSDNLGNPDKWQFPDYTIQAQEFLLVWCDEDQEQGLFHTNFKISAGGEELGIFDSETTGFAVIDQIVFGEQQTDISFGRDPDAGENWIFYEDPTPGISNTLNATVEIIKQGQALQVYPNPVNGNTINLNKISDIKIYSIAGQALISQDQTRQISVEILPTGLYFIKTRNGEVIKFIKQ